MAFLKVLLTFDPIFHLSWLSWLAALLFSLVCSVVAGYYKRARVKKELALDGSDLWVAKIFPLLATTGLGFSLTMLGLSVLELPHNLSDFLGGIAAVLGLQIIFSVFRKTFADRPPGSPRVSRAPANDKTNAGMFSWPGAELTGPPKSARLILAILYFLLALLTAYQTELSTRMMGRLVVSDATLRAYIEQSKRLSREVAMRASPRDKPRPEPPVTIDDVFFEESQQHEIAETVKELLNDPKVLDSFPDFDGVPLNQTRAVIVPLWALSSEGNRQKLGITEAGFMCSTNDKTFMPAFLTIRESPIGEGCIKRLRAAGVKYDSIEGFPVMTVDGVPRIAISPAAMVRPDTLKVALLHEFVHAHEVPGYRPFFNFVHDDLTYLPEYDRMLRKLNLDSAIKRSDLLLWFFTVTGLFLSAYNVYLALTSNSRSTKSSILSS